MVRGVDPHIQLHELFIEAAEELTAKSGEMVLGIFQDGWQAAAQLSDMLREHDPILGQQASDLVDKLSPAGDQPAAHPVLALQALLLNRLLRNKAHVGRVTASAMASASLASFLFDLT